MVERPERSRVPRRERDPRGQDWEVFVREEGPLRHVGSVRAPDAEAAHEHAGRLFGWYATEIWCVPVTAVERFASDSLADGTEGAAAEGPDGEPEPRTREP